MSVKTAYGLEAKLTWIAAQPDFEEMSPDDRRIAILEHQMRGMLFAPLKLRLFTEDDLHWDEPVVLTWESDVVVTARVEAVQRTKFVTRALLVDHYDANIPIELTNHNVMMGATIDLNLPLSVAGVIHSEG